MIWTPFHTRPLPLPSNIRAARSVPGVVGIAQTALHLFQNGLDTLQISQELGLSEARVSRMLFEQRSIGKGKQARAKIQDRSSLLEILDVDIETGVIRWLARNNEPSGSGWNKRYAGKVAGGVTGHGYWIVNINGSHHRAHLIIWTVAHGHWPCLDIDHIDGNRSNNRLENLREVTRSENLKNQGVSRRNSSGVLGVYFDRRLQKWAANIAVGKHCKHLGTFLTIEEAAEARRCAEERFGYHPNHGRREATHGS